MIFFQVSLTIEKKRMLLKTVPEEFSSVRALVGDQQPKRECNHAHLDR